MGLRYEISTVVFFWFQPFGLNFGPKYVLETNSLDQEAHTELTESSSTLDESNPEADNRSFDHSAPYNR